MKLSCGNMAAMREFVQWMIMKQCFFKCLDGKTKTGKINGGAVGYGVCVWKFGCLLNKKNKMK